MAAVKKIRAFLSSCSINILYYQQNSIKYKGGIVMDTGGTSMLCEQGDMGLWNTPVNEGDQKKLDESANDDKDVQADK